MTTIQPEIFDLVILGSGEAGKYLAWTLGKEGWKVALVERKMDRRLLPEYRVLTK